MSRRYRSPWWVSQRWEVEALTPDGWKTIYCARVKAAAQADAAAWQARTGQPTRIAPGAGHKSRRGSHPQAVQP